MNENFVDTSDGIRLSWRKLGNGPKAVVIPNGIYFLADFADLTDGHTLIAYDPRNRGQSDQSRDGDKLRGDIHLDVEDLEAVRRHFRIQRLDLIGHSYMGVTVALYAMKYPEHVNRIVQIGPMGPIAGKQYSPALSNNDGVAAGVFDRIGQLQKDRQPAADPVAFCRQAWAILAEIYVANPADAARADWGRCELPNELAFMHYWNGNLLPSIMSLRLETDMSKVKAPVLTIHGRKDRSAAYGAGREWALLLPDARLVTIDEGAHAPWIEAPDVVFGAIRTFLHGQWPGYAERVMELDPAAASA